MQARTNDRPRFRQDLVAESIDDHGGRFIDVMDPDTGNVFRFYEVEYSLACAMDGQRDVAGIVQWAREELGVTPSPAEIRTVMATLRELGFVEGIDRVAEAPARRGADPDLAPGVVVGDRADTIPGDVMGLELGEAGATAHINNDMPAAPNLTLGAPGASSPQRHPPAEDIPLGMPGPGDITARITEPEIQIQASPSMPAMPAARDVSLDLADQMTVRPDDVKEAVRASKVMKAVEVPREVMDALESAEMDPNAQTKVSPTPALRPTPPPPRRTPQPMPVAVPTPAAKAPAATPTPARDIPATRPTPLPVKPAAERPAPAPRSAVAQPAPPPTTRQTSPALIVALIIVILGAGAFALWKFVLDSDDAPTKSSTTPATGSAAVAITSGSATTPPKAEVETPKPPPAAKAKLSSEPVPSEDLKAPVAGTIDTIEANDKPVKPGDIVVRLTGHKAIEGDITTLAFDVDKRLPGEMAAAEKELTDAKAANNGAGETAAQKKLDDKKKALEDKQAQLAAKQTELDKFVVKVASAGKLTVVAKAGAKVAADEVLAKVAREPVLTATFEVKSSKLATGATVKLADDASPDKSYECTVAEVAGDKVKVICPGDPTLDGVAVTLTNP